MKNCSFKYLIFSILFSIIASFALASCSNDDDFGGVDNYITSFALSADNIELTAGIENDTVIITVPSNFAFDRATATYTLSENATISPDPATFARWNEETMFVVTAHNGSKRMYKYTVRDVESAVDGNITLRTQDDVNEFLHNGITKINGSLIIGKTTGTDSIRSLAALHKIKEISYNLTINPTYAGDELMGLENLEILGSLVTDTKLKTLTRVYFPNLRIVNLAIASNSYFQSLDCPKLERVEKDVTLYFEDSNLFNVGLTNLKSVGGNLLVRNDNALATDSRLLTFPKLETVGGGISLSSSKLDLQMPELHYCGGEFTLGTSKMSIINLPKLKEIKDKLTLTANQAAYIDFSALESVGSDLSITNQLASVANFGSLKTIGGKLTLNKLSLTNLDGFAALRSVGSDIALTALNIKSVDGLKSLKTIKSLTLSNCTSIERIDLTRIDIDALTLSTMNNTTVKGNEILTTALTLASSQAEFEGIKEIESLKITSSNSSNVFDLLLAGITKVGVLDVNVNKCKSFSMPDLEEVKSDFKFMWGTSDFTAFSVPKLTKVGGAFSFLTGGSATDFRIKTLSLPSLVSVGSNFTVYTHYSKQNEDIETIETPALTTIGGKLIIRNTYLTMSSAAYVNNKLLDLNGFSSLTSVQGIEITNQKGLRSYAGLRNVIATLPASAWKVTGNAYNPTYTDMVASNWDASN